MGAQVTFQQFILDQIKKHKSQQQFAARLGISQSTVSRWLDSENPTQPDLETMVKLAEVTQTSLETLVALLYPDVADKTRPSPTARLVGQSFDKLPQDLQSAIMAIIRGAGR